ncbi:unnamed protein product [Alopecurus aequalis]
MPQQRRRVLVAHRPPPYSKGWLSRRWRRDYVADDHDPSDTNGTRLPDNALSAVFARCANAKELVRCASTCRRWGRVVAEDAAALSRSHPVTSPSSRLLLGFFHHEDGAAIARKRTRTAAAGISAQPCFVPVPSGIRFLGTRSPSLAEAFDGVVGHGFFEHSRAVASRNGRLVLELRHQGRAAGLELCVCNPITGDMTLLPPLSGTDMPGSYASALLAGEEDLNIPPTFFRLLIVYNRRGFTALRAFSSDTGRWSPEARRSGPKITVKKLLELGQGVVLRGVAYWPLLFTALAVRIDMPEPRELPMPRHGLPGYREQGGRLLGVSHGGRLCCVLAGTAARKLAMVAYYFDPSAGECGEWEWKPGTHMMRPQKDIKVMRYHAINLRWLYERSGVILFTLGEGSSHQGTFAFDIESSKINELIHGVHCEEWKNFVGYEMDPAAYLASVAS